MFKFTIKLPKASAVVTTLVASAFLMSGLACAKDLFDKPLEVRRVHLKPGPKDLWEKAELTCYRFPKFTVKQFDIGEIGAELSIIPIQANLVPACERAKQMNEYVIPGDFWTGYFKGVKSDFIFFDDSDGNNGGMKFMVLRQSDNKKLFEDTAENGFQSISVKNGQLEMRYLRVFVSDCSMVSAEDVCRDSIEKKIQVSLEPLSFCGKQYEAAKRSLAKARCEAQSETSWACIDTELTNINAQKWDEAPTVVVYGVEVSIGDAAPILKPRGKAMDCHPAD